MGQTTLDKLKYLLEFLNISCYLRNATNTNALFSEGFTKLI